MKENAAFLDLSSFDKAIKSLDEAVQEYQKNPENKFVRDAAIQRFEYTFELSHKMLRRYLELTEPSADIVEEMTYPTLIRTGSEKGLLLSAWNVWKDYRQGRNLTSHTYDEDKAVYVYSVIPSFLKDAQYLLHKLHERLEAL
ncbi:MAG: nucleotidyltransferase substrate binding protein [Gammaproteobacteria bacterium]